MKKKICFLMDSLFTVGGVQRVTAVIAKELAKTDDDLTIVSGDLLRLLRRHLWRTSS